MESTLDGNGIIPLVLTQKLRYSVYFCPKNDFSALNSNTASVIICRTFSIAFRWFLNSFLLTNSISSIYSRTMSNPLNSSDIFSWKIWGLLQTPIRNFWYSYLPHIIAIVKSCLDPSDNYM